MTIIPLAQPLHWCSPCPGAGVRLPPPARLPEWDGSKGGTSQGRTPWKPWIFPVKMYCKTTLSPPNLRCLSIKLDLTISKLDLTHQQPLSNLPHFSSQSGVFFSSTTAPGSCSSSSDSLEGGEGSIASGGGTTVSMPQGMPHQKWVMDGSGGFNQPTNQNKLGLTNQKIKV